MNVIHLIGRLGQDPETVKVGETSVTKFSIATTETWKDRTSGEKMSHTDWHNCECWGKVGSEVIQKYVQKGHQLSVTGSVKYEEYEKDGETRKATKIKVVNVELLANNPTSSSGSSEPAADDDIPF